MGIWLFDAASLDLRLCVLDEVKKKSGASHFVDACIERPPLATFAVTLCVR